ncbi:hypothetical protein ACFWJ5_28445 [Streptomyces qaidamensis]|uniref:hypothetical protein n=1 Tax=Streptomyces qaidamensis TaxID=1783515 RepID=UPI003649AE6E
MMTRITGRAGRLAVAVAGATLALGVSVGSGPAWAYIEAWQGDDNAKGFEGDRRLRVCDMEADTNAVEGEYFRVYDNDSSHLWDKNGAGPDNCVRTGAGAILNKIRVCEQQFAKPDACGSWAYRI